MDQVTRQQMLTHLTQAATTTTTTHPTRIAIDGPPAAGKTTLADELATTLRTHGHHVVRATIDDFIHPRAHRYRNGEYSAESCYHDAHDHHTLNRVLLDPLGPHGDRRFQHTIYDHATDTVLSPPATTATPNAILIFDGVFLLRPELIDRWDLRILVTTSPEQATERAVVRERHAQSRAEVDRRWRERYIPAQQLYVATVDPARHADIIVHNDEPQMPILEAGGRGVLAIDSPKQS